MAEINHQFDDVINIVNRHHYETKLKSIEQERELARADRESRRRKYQVRKQQRAKSIRNNAILGIVAAATIITAGKGISKQIDRIDASNDFISSITTEVAENIKYTDTLNADGNGYTWYYDDLDDIVDETLNENKEVDIDTRLYSTYTSLKEYQRNKYMDQIMRRLQNIVTTNPDAYTEDELRACNHATFDEYIAELGLNKEEYLDLMKDITFAYSQNNLEAVDSLLSRLTVGLNGGGR